MPIHDLAPLNWLAIAAAALAAFFLGAIWYTALFGKLWQRQHGYTPEMLKHMQTKRPMALFLGGLLVCYFMASFAMAILMSTAGWSGMHAGVHAALLTWFIVASFRFTGHWSGPKPIGAFLIDSAFDLVALLAMGLILGSWR